MAFTHTYYNALDCSITVNNVSITGLGEGDMVKGEKDNDYFGVQEGAQGDVVENEINSCLGTVTITVLGTCPQLPYLMSLAESGQHFPIWVINKSQGIRFGGSNARVRTCPTQTQGKEAGEVEFAVQVFDYTVTYA